MDKYLEEFFARANLTNDEKMLFVSVYLKNEKDLKKTCAVFTRLSTANICIHFLKLEEKLKEEGLAYVRT